MAADDCDVYSSFIRETLKSSEDPGLLTKRILVTKYLENSGKESLSIEEKEIFSAAIIKIFKEDYANGSPIKKKKTASDVKSKPKTKNGAKKIVSSDDDNGTDHSDEDDVSEIKKTKETKRKPVKNVKISGIRKRKTESEDDDFSDDKKSKKKQRKVSSSSSDEEPLKPSIVKKDHKSPKANNDDEIGAYSESLNESTSTVEFNENKSFDLESGEEFKKKNKGTVKKSKESEESNVEDSNSEKETDNSEDEHEERKQTKNRDSSTKKKKTNVISDDDEKSNSECEVLDSDNEPKKKEHAKKKGDSSDEKKKITTKSGKDEDDPKIVRMKKYYRLAGLRTPYVKLFENCRSIKSKVQKLQEELEEAGLKGSPTIEKCKHLKKKRERKQELAELDLGNILTNNEGRSRRSVRTPFQSPSPARVQSKPENNSVKRQFSRLKDIVDSEESD